MNSPFNQSSRLNHSRERPFLERSPLNSRDRFSLQLIEMLYNKSNTLNIDDEINTFPIRYRLDVTRRNIDDRTHHHLRAVQSRGS